MGAGPGAFGPYRHGSRWRVLVRARDGARATASFATQAAAERFQRDAAAEIAAEKDAERTVAEAIDAYAAHLRAKGNLASSTKETPRRLRWFFAADLEDALEGITPARGKALYERIATATYQRGATTLPYSVDTCRNTLAEARSFLAWCAGEKWIRGNPLDGVKGKGKRRHGKPQLTIDEARSWSAEALRRAGTGDVGAVAALLTVTLGLRAGEIVQRLVRDLDDDGRLLHVTSAKTEAGVRTVEVPAMLRPFLLELAAGLEPSALLFGKHWRDWPRENVQRICTAAKVPQVTAHGMRGLHATLAVQAGATAHLVAAALGHESETTTQQSYVAPGVAEAQRGRAALTVLKGGR